ncbi:MAG TPA: acyl-CoA dehydrogenase family protein [Solirubrobacterales bacterium]|nr:acyl-CoA dehydrogenase family protein [Solirubrobacterales bacterium]
MNTRERAIDYPLTDEQRAVRAHAREFAETELAPRAEEFDAADEFQPELHRLLVGSGLLAHFVPEEFGGNGLSVTNVCTIREQLSRVCPTADEYFASQGLGVQALVMWCSEEQKRSFLGGLMDGSQVFAFCLSEPGAGSDVGGIETVATAAGDDYVINGKKRFIFAPEAATTLVVFAKTDPELGKRGISAFAVDQPAEGIRCEPFHLLKPAPHAEVYFEDCRVPASAMVGERGAGIRVALSNLDRLRPSVGAAAVGMAEAALAAATGYARDRNAFGGRLSDLQAVRFRIAAAEAELDAARLIVYAAAANADAEALELAASSGKAKLVATETAWKVIDSAIQIHGGAGLRRGSITERVLKASRATRIYEGSSEIMQLVISRSIFPRA